MPNGDQMSSELGFLESFRKMPAEERAAWMAEKIFYISVTMGKISYNQDTIGERVETIEGNCKQRMAMCDLLKNQVQAGTPGTPDRRQTLKYAVYGGAGTIGAGGIIYAIIEIIQMILKRGG